MRPISLRQAMILYFCMIIPPSIRVSLTLATRWGLELAWLAPLFGGLVLLPLLALLAAVVRQRKGDMDLADVILRAFGRWGGRLVLGCCAVWLLLLASTF